MKIKVLLMALIATAGIACGKDKLYQGELITPNSIMCLLGDMPTAVAAGVKAFLETEPAVYNYDFVGLYPKGTHVLQLLESIMPDADCNGEGMTYSERAQAIIDLNQEAVGLKLRDNRISLAAMDVVNLARNNCIFHVPGMSNWVVKIASPGNRVVNLYTAMGFNVYNKRPMVEGDTQIRDIDDSTTYQTISVAQVALILRDLINKHNLQHVSVPATYLYRMPETRGLDCANHHVGVSDSNSFVVQEYVPCLRFLHKEPELVADKNIITPAMVQELRFVTEEAGLWDHRRNLAVCVDKDSKHHKRFVIFDTEQRNLTSPGEFSSVADDVHQHITNVGMQQLRDIFAERDDLLEVLK